MLEGIAKLFLSYTPLFNVYGYYAANQASSTYLLRQYLSKPAFKKVIQEYTSNPKTPQSIESYLIAPTQV